MKKNIAELIDALTITNNKIWHLIDDVMGADSDNSDTEYLKGVVVKAKQVQKLNSKRVEIMNAISEYFGDKPDIKVYSKQ
jgi:hypothetical protein